MKTSPSLLALEALQDELRRTRAERIVFPPTVRGNEAKVVAVFNRRKPITVFAWVDDEPGSVEALRSEVVKVAKRYRGAWIPADLDAAVRRLVAAEKREGV